MSPVSASAPVSEPKTAFAQWIVEPYGAPGTGCEVGRIAGFYRAEALTVCGNTICGKATGDCVALDKAA